MLIGTTTRCMQDWDLREGNADVTDGGQDPVACSERSLRALLLPGPSWRRMLVSSR